MDWKGTISTVSEKVFPGISHKNQESLYGNEVMSNLPLQIALYLNVMVAPFWALTWSLSVNLKYQDFTEIYKFITISVLATVFLVEIIRLYLGYIGNLQDKIPELAAFWMLSLLLQLPLNGLLLFNPYYHFYILQISTQIIIFVLLCVQLICGYYTLNRTATQQALYFRIMRMKSNPSLIQLTNIN